MPYNFIISTFWLKNEEDIIIKYNDQIKGREILNVIISANNIIDLEVISSNLKLKEEISLSNDFINYIK